VFRYRSRLERFSPHDDGCPQQVRHGRRRRVGLILKSRKMRPKVGTARGRRLAVEGRRMQRNVPSWRGAKDGLGTYFGNTTANHGQGRIFTSLHLQPDTHLTLSDLLLTNDNARLGNPRYLRHRLPRTPVRALKTAQSRVTSSTTTAPVIRAGELVDYPKVHSPNCVGLVVAYLRSACFSWGMAPSSSPRTRRDARRDSRSSHVYLPQVHRHR
jgi:hypothetical protein